MCILLIHFAVQANVACRISYSVHRYINNASCTAWHQNICSEYQTDFRGKTHLFFVCSSSYPSQPSRRQRLHHTRMLDYNFTAIHPNSCGGISLKTTGVNVKVVLEEKPGGFTMCGRGISLINPVEMYWIPVGVLKCGPTERNINITRLWVNTRYLMLMVCI